MHRQPEHVIQFLFAELGTSGSVDGNGRLVIKGRFQQKQIENVLRRYIGELRDDLRFLGVVHWLFIANDADCAPSCFSRIRYVQDLQIARHTPDKGQPYLLRHLRDVSCGKFVCLYSGRTDVIIRGSLLFLNSSCGSKQSVSSIKVGYQAQTKRRPKP